MSNSRFDEEIDLKEYIKIINKRKIVVLCVTFIVVVLTGIINFSVPKTYEVNAVIQNGYLDAPILTYPEASAILKSRDFSKPIFEKYGINFPENEKGFKKMFEIENVKDSNLILIKIKYRDKDALFSLTKEIINVYLEYGNSLYSVQNNSIKNHIIQIESLIEKTKLSMDKNALVKKEGILPLAFPDDKVQLKDLFSVKSQLESRLSAAKEFKLIDAPVKPSRPISPNISQNISMFLVFGLLLGIFCAIFMENWKKSEAKN